MNLNIYIIFYTISCITTDVSLLSPTISDGDKNVKLGFSIPPNGNALGKTTAVYSVHIY